MKKTAFLFLALMGCTVFGVGCGGGPEISTEEEAASSMAESMAVDTMAETEAEDGGASADPTGAAAPAGEAAPAGDAEPAADPANP